MTDDLIQRLRAASDDGDMPWWWDVPERGGPANLLREAADRLEQLEAAGCRHVLVEDRWWCPYKRAASGRERCEFGFHMHLLTSIEEAVS